MGLEIKTIFVRRNSASDSVVNGFLFIKEWKDFLFKEQHADELNCERSPAGNSMISLAGSFNSRVIKP